MSACLARCSSSTTTPASATSPRGSCRLGTRGHRRGRQRRRGVALAPSCAPTPRWSTSGCPTATASGWRSSSRAAVAAARRPDLVRRRPRERAAPPGAPGASGFLPKDELSGHALRRLIEDGMSAMAPQARRPLPRGDRRGRRAAARGHRADPRRRRARRRRAVRRRRRPAAPGARPPARRRDRRRADAAAARGRRPGGRDRAASPPAGDRRARSSRSSASPPSRSSSSASAPRASATCSRSASATSRRSSTPSRASRPAAARSTPRWSAGCSAVPTPDDPLRALTPRERAVLAAMAEGKSNLGIAQTLFVSEAAVEKHVTGDLPQARHRAREHRAPPGPRRPDVSAGNRGPP